MEPLIDCYIINLLTGTTIKFKLTPESYQESIDASFDKEEIRGRSTAFVSYGQTGARTASFPITLHEEYCEGGIWATVNKIKALVYPVYSGSIVRPPKCYVRFGNMMAMHAIIEGVSVDWEPPIIKDKFGRKVFAKANVQFSFTEFVKKDQYDAYGMELGGELNYYNP